MTVFSLEAVFGQKPSVSALRQFRLEGVGLLRALPVGLDDGQAAARLRLEHERQDLGRRPTLEQRTDHRLNQAGRAVDGTGVAP